MFDLLSGIHATLESHNEISPDAMESFPRVIWKIQPFIPQLKLFEDKLLNFSNSLFAWFLSLYEIWRSGEVKL